MASTGHAAPATTRPPATRPEWAPQPEGRLDASAPEPPALARRLGAEFVATFFLVLVEAGGAMTSGIAPGEVTSAARALASGLVIAAMVLMVGPVSGAHLNPAITLGFALRRVFAWRHVPLYWGAQLAGAFLAVLALRGVLGNVQGLGAPTSAFGPSSVFAWEALLTLLLVSVVLGTATHSSIVGPNAAIATGATVAVAGLFSRPISGASMNPARALAPAVVSGHTATAWIYVAAPLAGAIVAVGLAWVLHGVRRRGESERAEGAETRTS